MGSSSFESPSSKNKPQFLGAPGDQPRHFRTFICLSATQEINQKSKALPLFPQTRVLEIPGAVPWFFWKTGGSQGSLIHIHLSVSRHRAETGHSAARTCRENLQLPTGRRAKTDALGPAESTWGLVIGELVSVLKATFIKPLPYVNPLRSSPVK